MNRRLGAKGFYLTLVRVADSGRYQKDVLLFMFVQSHIFTFLIFKLTFYDLADDLENDLESPKQYYKSIFPVKIP